MKGLAALTGLRGWPEGGGPSGQGWEQKMEKGGRKYKIRFWPQ